MYSLFMISQRRFKKLRRIMTNQVRNDLKEKLQTILRPKPRLWPKWFWKMMIKKLLDIPETK